MATIEERVKHRRAEAAANVEKIARELSREYAQSNPIEYMAELERRASEYGIDDDTRRQACAYAKEQLNSRHGGRDAVVYRQATATAAEHPKRPYSTRDVTGEMTFKSGYWSAYEGDGAFKKQDTGHGGHGKHGHGGHGHDSHDEHGHDEHGHGEHGHGDGHGHGDHGHDDHDDHGHDEHHDEHGDDHDGHGDDHGGHDDHGDDGGH